VFHLSSSVGQGGISRRPSFLEPSLQRAPSEDRCLESSVWSTLQVNATGSWGIAGHEAARCCVLRLGWHCRRRADVKHGVARPNVCSRLLHILRSAHVALLPHTYPSGVRASISQVNDRQAKRRYAHSGARKIWHIAQHRCPKKCVFRRFFVDHTVQLECAASFLWNMCCLFGDSIALRFFPRHSALLFLSR
jgi:hypothetical protein